MVVILIGPMGSGKTRIGELRSQKLGWRFIEGDAFHPPQNVAKMKAGVPLDDADRLPWLAALRKEVEACLAGGAHAVVACSALKQAYREALGVDQATVRSVYLRGSRAVLRQRLSGRDHAYMPDGLLNSQLETMEEPTEGITVDIAATPEAIVEGIVGALQGLP
jgi:carbohydrate kinase (thermoresistant glucokinase family)